ncbi:MAG: hypothetical protein K1W24_11120 [Lachnospiraceae bacterium]
MEKLIEKLDSYSILNNLLPGAVFAYLFEYIFEVDIVRDGIVENLFIYYFIGMIVSRIGSLAVEPLCKKIKWVKYADYSSYIKASRKDDKIDVLSEVNNSFRTIFSLCLILITTKIYMLIVAWLEIPQKYNKLIVLTVITLIFAVSYRKQTKYVVDRVNKANEQEGAE